MTWDVLLDTLYGLWDFLIVDDHSMEANFEVTYVSTPFCREKLVGRGSVEIADVRSTPSPSPSPSPLSVAAKQMRKGPD